MMCYRDRMFCNQGDKNSDKCRECDRYFDEEKYKQDCEQRGFKYPVAFFEKKPCEREEQDK